MNFKINLF